MGKKKPKEFNFFPSELKVSLFASSVRNTLFNYVFRPKVILAGIPSLHYRLLVTFFGLLVAVGIKISNMPLVYFF